MVKITIEYDGEKTSFEAKKFVLVTSPGDGKNFLYKKGGVGYMSLATKIIDNAIQGKLNGKVEADWREG